MGIGYWFDPVGTVTKLVEEWRPRKCSTEKDYEQSLFRHLEQKLEGKDVVKQYAVGRVRGDIVVDKDILIELKADLDSAAKLQRLLGQIDIYKREWKKSVVLVLCGDHDRNLVKQAKQAVGEGGGLLGEPDIRLLIK